MKDSSSLMRIHSIFKKLIICAVLSFFLSASLTGCAMIMRSATSDMVSHLSDAILNNDDLKTVEQGAPSYLLMIDSLISKDSENIKMLYTAANLYCSYSGLFVDDPERSRKMAKKAMRYAQKAICLDAPSTCDLSSLPFEEFEQVIAKLEHRNVATLYALGNAWARWIISNSEDFDAIADLASIELIMNRVIDLDPDYQDGAAWVYLGTLSCLLPPALGGTPEKGKQYYEKALEISKGKNLMVKVLYAQYYARIIYDRELHDNLLSEVLDANAEIKGYTLINTWAKTQAQKLIADADEYF